MRNDLLWEKINNELSGNKVEIKTLGEGLWFSAIGRQENRNKPLPINKC